MWCHTTAAATAGAAHSSPASVAPPAEQRRVAERGEEAGMEGEARVEKNQVGSPEPPAKFPNAAKRSPR
jgi:hypothetical protein